MKAEQQTMELHDGTQRKPLASNELWRQARDRIREDLRQIVDAAFVTETQERRCTP